MRLEFKSLGIWSVVKVGFVCNLIIGFVLGLLMALFMLPFIALMSTLEPSAATDFDTSAISGPLMIIVLPIMYSLFNAVFGTIMVFFAALIYNLAARLLGGIEYEVGILDTRDLLEAVQATPPGQAGYGQPAGGYYQPLQQQPPYQPNPQPRPTPPPSTPPPAEPPPPPPSDNRPADDHPDRPEGY